MQIPALTASNAEFLGNGALVRYRAMVADILNPEYFIGAFQDAQGGWHTTKYGDPSPDILNNSVDTRIWERKVYYCVPVPGQADWATARLAAGPAQGAAAAGARWRGADAGAAPPAAVQTFAAHAAARRL